MKASFCLVVFAAVVTSLAGCNGSAISTRADGGTGSNTAPYKWYRADATAELRAGESGALLRLRAGPSSNALIVNRVELCFDAP